MMEVHIIIPIIISCSIPILCYLFHSIGKLDAEIEQLEKELKELEKDVGV